jgi:hypothetical protein
MHPISYTPSNQIGKLKVSNTLIKDEGVEGTNGRWVMHAIIGTNVSNHWGHSSSCSHK